MPRDGSCAGCCVRNLDCESCQRCAPRYLCVNVDVTPGPYTDLSCCAVDDYGIGHFGFRATYTCSSWSGQGGCDAINLDVTVTVSRGDLGCQTAVSSTHFDTLTFDGVLPSGMSGSFVTDAGDTIAWEIAAASVVENPMIRQKCSPCSCATCIPSRLCITANLEETAYFAAFSGATSTTWDCATTRYTQVEIGDVTINVVPRSGFDELPVDDRVCGLDVTISGHGAELSDTIVLENGLHWRKIRGTECEDSNGLLMTQGSPELLPCPEGDPDCETPPPQVWVSYIDETFQLYDGDVFVGTVRIQDQSCGECEFCEQIETVCCSGVLLPSTLTAVSSGIPSCPSCGAAADNIWTMSYDPGIGADIGGGWSYSGAWTASKTVCERTWSVIMFCAVNNAGEALGWYMQPFCSGEAANSPAIGTVECEPFLGQFLSVLFNNNPPCNCYDEFGNPTEFRADFEVTA